MRYKNLIPNFFEKTTSSEKRDVSTLYIYLIKFSNIYMICNCKGVIIIHPFENILSLSGMFQQAQHSNSLIHVVRLLQQMNGCFKLLTDRYSYGVSKKWMTLSNRFSSNFACRLTSQRIPCISSFSFYRKFTSCFDIMYNREHSKEVKR